MSASDRIKGRLLDIIQHVLKPTDYHALYPARVVSQTPGGLLEVIPDDTRLSGMTVPIRYGIPCVTAKIRKDSRVLIGFEGGNPKKPVATLWDAADIEQIIIAPDKLFIGSDGGNAWPIARQGDYIECLLPPVMPVAGTLSGAPFSGVLTIIDPVVGVISSGAAKGACE